MVHQFTGYLNSHKLLYNHQYGFRKKHGGTHAVLQFLNRIFQGFTKDIPEHTISIFLDLKKAFDTVDHDILLKKISTLWLQLKCIGLV